MLVRRPALRALLRAVRPLALAPLLVAGCGDGNNNNNINGGPDLGVPSDPCAAKVANNSLYAGGITITNPAGDYCLLTRDGATPPVPGSATLGSDPTPWGLHLGFAADPKTSMVVSWRTRDEKTLATTVQWGEGGKTDQTTDGYTWTWGNDNEFRAHETHLVGLKPDTVYSYRVGGKGTGAEKWSDVYTFHTAPSKADAPINIVLIGDTRDNAMHYAKWGSMVNAAATTGMPDLVLFSGDATTLGTLQNEWDDFFTVAEPVLRQVPIAAAHGNHEINAVNYYSQFALPGDEENFSFEWGNAHVTVLNDTPRNAGDITAVSLPFLESDLKAHDAATWKLLMHHKPPYSAGSHGSELSLRMAWGATVDAHKVDFVLNGHDHDYQRTKPMRGGVAAAKPTDGTTYVVAGSAGAPLYDVTPTDFIAVAKQTYSYVILKIRGTTVDMKSYDDMGTVIDTFTYTK